MQTRIALVIMDRCRDLYRLEELSKGRHFDREIIILCVRWYLSFKLSYRDLVAVGGHHCKAS